ncbi:hypothetical protein PQX77_013933 [Marasmius sp. AFHP31]|nr:hypothetical protein PQX77_013933 [Marasmius sp. AFHP31]
MNSSANNNTVVTHDLDVQANVADVPMAPASPNNPAIKLGSLPAPVREDIKRMLRRNFGPQFSVEDFFKSFELTLEGLNKTLMREPELWRSPNAPWTKRIN